MATQEVKKSRITAGIFGLLSGLTLIAFAYAFFQQAEAARQKSLAVELSQEIQKHQRELGEMTQLIQRQNEDLERAANEMRTALIATQEELRKCKGK